MVIFWMTSNYCMFKFNNICWMFQSPDVLFVWWADEIIHCGFLSLWMCQIKNWKCRCSRTWVHVYRFPCKLYWICIDIAQLLEVPGVPVSMVTALIPSNSVCSSHAWMGLLGSMSATERSACGFIITCLNSLRHSAIIWHHRPWSRLVQAMAYQLLGDDTVHTICQHWFW